MTDHPEQNRLAWLIICFCSLLFFYTVSHVAPHARTTNVNPTEFTESTLLLRGLSGPFHTLIADRFWLLSSSLNEIPSHQAQHEDSAPFFNAMQTVAILDPGYLSSLRYGSTYLASIYRQVDHAHKLLDAALDHEPKFSDLLLLKISLEMGYHSPPRYALIQRWVNQVETIEGNAPDWLGRAVLYAREREIKHTLQKEDLLWLEQHVKTDSEKKAISEKMADLNKLINR